MDSSERVLINDSEHLLRNDGTIYLGMNTWFRPVGTKRWCDTNFHGRATLTPGINYESMICPEGSEPGSRMTFIDRIRLFFSRWL